MKVFKVLNLYAGIGGNRKLWSDKLFRNCDYPYGSSVNITAVELNPKIAKIYKDFFPHDEVIVADAAEYLAKHYDEFDFIWSSPPCQSHSKLSIINNTAKRYKNTRKLPDMTLYSQIIYLQKFFKGDFVVENVRPFYKVLIEPTFAMGRHLFWSNKFFLNSNIDNAKLNVRHTIKKKTHRLDKSDWKELQKLHGFDISKYKGIKKEQVLRNCVYPEIGKYIFYKVVGLE